MLLEVLRKVVADRRGQDTVEYALIAAFIATAAAALSPAVLSVAAFMAQSFGILDIALAATANR